MSTFVFQEAKKAAKLIKDRFGIEEVTYTMETVGSILGKIHRNCQSLSVKLF